MMPKTMARSEAKVMIMSAPHARFNIEVIISKEAEPKSQSH